MVIQSAAKTPRVMSDKEADEQKRASIMETLEMEGGYAEGQEDHDYYWVTM